MTAKKGFAAMSPEKQRELSSKGGKAAHASGRAHQFTSEEARLAGAKGGFAVSQNRGYMREIGTRGGYSVSRDREHMKKIGRLGGSVK